MPYPNEHSARLQEPGRFNPDTFRRTDDGTIYGKIKVPATAAVIWGKLKGRDKPADNPIPQAIRFPMKNWTAEEARKWLKDNNVKYISFTPATGGKKSQAGDDCAARQATIQNILYELQSQTWVMEAGALERLFAAIASQQTVPPRNVAIETKPAAFRLEGSTAVISIKGVLMREIPAAFAWWGIEGTSYTAIGQQVQAALSDERIEAIHLEVDSPGGTVPGVDETAEIIRAARDQKPVTAMIDDLGASGAYWLAAQANHIEAVKNGMAGSIGVFSVYLDRSEMAKQLGIKVIVIRSGEHKGMGVPGAPITDAQISAMQQIIDGLAENFIAAVAAGRQRDKEDVRVWATGQLWLAQTARELGVIDRVTSSMKQNQSSSSKEQTMNEMTDQQIDTQIDKNQLRQAAEQEQRERLKDLKAEFGEDLPFAVDAFEKGLSLEQAKAAYCDVLKAKLKEKEQAKKGNQTATADGAPPINSSGTDGQNQVDFIQAARDLAAEKKISLTAAMRTVARQQSQLHEAFLARCKTEGRAMYESAVA